ncbi:MAG: hypothetical protein KUG77_19515, partial [Nannocystaceae bacterium]|nr:hypothetical protein [Nannocystaceae bacterium]
MLARLGLATSLMLVACDGPPPAEAPAKSSNKTASGPDTPPEPKSAPKPTPETKACTDWSKEDLSDAPPLPESRYRRTLEQAWTLVLEKHYDPTLGCVDWPDARVRYGSKLAQTKDQLEAFAVINEMLSELGQSHVKLFSGGSDEAMGPASVELKVRWIQGSLVVVAAPPDSAVKTGAVLEKVAGTRVSELTKRAEQRTERAAEFASLTARLAAAKLSCPAAGEARTCLLYTSDAAD